MTQDKLMHILESILFLSGQAVSIKEIAEKLEVKEKDILACASKLEEKYTSPCGISIMKVNGKLQFSSNPEYAEEVSTVLNPIRERNLSKAMLEVVSIIAYKQPITRLEIEQMRGVSCEYAVRVLLENNLIEVVGRRDTIGKPILFGTTEKFLKHFQIESLEQLPAHDSLLEKIKVINTEIRDIYDKTGSSVQVDNDILTTEEVPENEELPEHLKDEEIIEVE